MKANKNLVTIMKRSILKAKLISTKHGMQVNLNYKTLINRSIMRQNQIMKIIKI